MNKHSVPMMMTESAIKAMLDYDDNDNDYEFQEIVSKVSENTYTLGISGPLIKKGSWWTSLFGLSAYSSITSAFKKLLNEPTCKNIILDIDSPGGMVYGCGELADLIYKAREQKNIIAYISGQGCSAAYYLASAAGNVYANKASSVGSIGVVACYEINKDKNTKTIEIVSSKSKDKRLDIETKEGQEKVQTEVDDLADIFAEDVAKFRNMKVAAVEQTNGGTFVGQKALEMGLIDGVSELETIVKELTMNDIKTTETVASHQETAKVATANKVDIVAEETARVSAIMSKGAEKGYSMTAAKALVEAKVDVDSALKVLEGQKTDAEASHPSIVPTGFEKAMAATKNPQIEAKEEKTESLEAEIDSYFKA